MLLGAARRLRIQMYADVLWAIHSTNKSGAPLSMYRIERIAGLTYAKLREVLEELDSLDLTDGGMKITNRGYAFLTDLSSKVVPALSKYGLWNGRT